jgi:two-component system OmpR family response regulator
LVFVVDDEPNIVTLLLRVLEADYEVRCFSDSKKALAAAIDANPAALVVDYLMPELNGVELIRALRHANCPCAVLMTTGVPELPEVVTAEKDRLFFRIVPKPWAPQDLLAQLQLAIGSYRVAKATGRFAKTSSKP